MDTKRFIGPDMRSALRMVREQLGPDAVILSNRRVGGGVEILAADDLAPSGGIDPAAPLPAAAKAAPPASARTARAEAPLPPPTLRPDPAPARMPSDTLVEVRGELRELRNLMERQLAGTRADGIDSGLRAEGLAWRQLTRAGLPNDVVRLLVEAVDRDTSGEALADMLARAVPEAGDVVLRGGLIAAVGPTGAGKTTTLCKLAVRHVLQHGPGSLVLASADSARLGGVDMLRAVARLLEVPFLAAAEGESMVELIARAGAPDLLLLDTPGLSRRRPEDADRLHALAAAGVQSLVVLPANAQLAWLDAAVGDYRTARPVAAVVTKLDETVSLGEVLGVLLREGLPLAYVTDGPEIPDDIHVCEAREIARRALELAEEDPAQALRAARPDLTPANAARIA